MQVFATIGFPGGSDEELKEPSTTAGQRTYKQLREANRAQAKHPHDASVPVRVLGGPAPASGNTPAAAGPRKNKYGDEMSGED